jgi:hypothetical protein
VHAHTETNRTDDDVYRAFDWRVSYTVEGREREGAIGRTGAQGRAEIRVVEALDALPNGVSGHGEVIRTNVADPELKVLVAFAYRDVEGAICWTTP